MGVKQRSGYAPACFSAAPAVLNPHPRVLSPPVDAAQGPKVAQLATSGAWQKGQLHPFPFISPGTFRFTEGWGDLETEKSAPPPGGHCLGDSPGAAGQAGGNRGQGSIPFPGRRQPSAPEVSPAGATDRIGSARPDPRAGRAFRPVDRERPTSSGSPVQVVPRAGAVDRVVARVAPGRATGCTAPRKVGRPNRSDSCFRSES